MIWSSVLQWANLSEVVPLATLSVQDWWQNASSRIQGNKSNTLNSLVRLVIWSIWRERKARVLDKRCTPLQTIIDQVKDDARQREVASLGRLTLNQIAANCNDSVFSEGTMFGSMYIGVYVIFVVFCLTLLDYRLVVMYFTSFLPLI